MNWINHLYGDVEHSGLIKELSKRVGILKKLRPMLPLKNSNRSYHQSLPEN